MAEKESSKLRFDRRCVEMVGLVLSGRSTVRREVYKEKDPKMYHRLVHTVVENHELLTDVIRKCKYMDDDRELGVVRCFQILDRRVNNTRMRKRFLRALDGRELRFTRQAVFVRVNTLRAGGEADVGAMRHEKTCVEYVYRVLDSKDVSSSEGYKAGRLVIQNISSCLPAYILSPEKGSVVIDTCAAPGNKTSHLSMLMENTGRIHAFEKSPSRARTLEAQLEKLGVENTGVVEGDFMDARPDDFPGVRYVLCDPSCSGSGIHLGYKKDEGRVEALKAFQMGIVRHALGFRPERLVYSVCSDHEEEGEQVVEAVLGDSEYELEDISRFWAESSSSGFAFSHKVIRCRGGESGAAGFFIALLVRKDVVGRDGPGSQQDK